MRALLVLLIPDGGQTLTSHQGSRMEVGVLTRNNEIFSLQRFTILCDFTKYHDIVSSCASLLYRKQILNHHDWRIKRKMDVQAKHSLGC